MHGTMLHAPHCRLNLHVTHLLVFIQQLYLVRELWHRCRRSILISAHLHVPTRGLLVRMRSLQLWGTDCMAFDLDYRKDAADNFDHKPPLTSVAGHNIHGEMHPLTTQFK